MLNPFRRQTDPDTARFTRLISYALLIPTVLVASPLLGGLLGWWIGGYFGHARAGSYVGFLFGFISGGMQTADLVKRIMQELK
jgi:zinc transporter ZupT